jgi:hypothetical protein
VCIRDHTRTLLNIEQSNGVPRPAPSPEAVEAFLDESGPGPTEYEFSLVWEGAGMKEWNNVASKIFERSFRNACNDGFWIAYGVDEDFIRDVDISKIFNSKIRYLRSRYNSKRLTDAEKDRDQQKQRINARRHGVRAIS